MIYTAVADTSQNLLNPALFRDWGTAGILLFALVLGGAFFYWALPKVVTIAVNLNGAMQTAADMRKDIDERLHKMDTQINRLEVVVAKAKSRQWSSNGAHADPMHQSD